MELARPNFGWYRRLGAEGRIPRAAHPAYQLCSPRSCGVPWPRQAQQNSVSRAVQSRHVWVLRGHVE